MATSETQLRIPGFTRLEALEIQEAAGEDAVEIVDKPANPGQFRELATAAILLWKFTPAILTVVAAIIARRKAAGPIKITVDKTRKGKTEHYDIEITKGGKESVVSSELVKQLAEIVEKTSSALKDA
ncbi:MAG: hypothetical protein ABJE10_01990 [bacterium]